MEASAKKDAGVGREEPDKEAPPLDEESFDGEITESDQLWLPELKTALCLSKS